MSLLIQICMLLLSKSSQKMDFHLRCMKLLLMMAISLKYLEFQEYPKTLLLMERKSYSSSMEFLIQQTVGFPTKQMLLLHLLLQEQDMMYGLETQEETNTLIRIQIQVFPARITGIFHLKQWELMIYLLLLTMY